MPMLCFVTGERTILLVTKSIDCASLNLPCYLILQSQHLRLKICQLFEFPGPFKKRSNSIKHIIRHYEFTFDLFFDFGCFFVSQIII